MKVILTFWAKLCFDSESGDEGWSLGMFQFMSCSHGCLTLSKLYEVGLAWQKRILSVQLLSLVTLLVASCQLSPLPSELEGVLEEAGDNKLELLEVLNNCREDSVALSCATFLIGNMSGKYSLESPELDKYYDFLDSVFKCNKEKYDIEGLSADFHSLIKKRFREIQPSVRLDAKTLDADYIIDDIECSLAVWGNSWNDYLSLPMFQELVLPYRVLSEPVRSWRKTYHDKYNKFAEYEKISARDYCDSINRLLIRDSVKIYPNSILPVSLPIDVLENMRFGQCSDCAILAAYSMRACGLPVALCEIPHWGKKSGSHMFNAILDHDGLFYDFLGTETLTGKHLSLFHENAPKVYVRTYGIQMQSLAYQFPEENKPEFFRSKNILDITDKIASLRSAKLTVPKSYCMHDAETAYLCVFDIHGWVPIAWAKETEGVFDFGSVGTGNVYAVGTYVSDSMVVCGCPFVWDGPNEVKRLIPQAPSRVIALDRKYPSYWGWEDTAKKLVGGRFEGANSRDFSDAVVLATITTPPSIRYEYKRVNCKLRFKYVRYIGDGKSEGNMAEVEFYSENKDLPLEGHCYASYKKSEWEPQSTPDLLYDGDALTYFHCGDSTNWSALEFENPVEISSIRYIMRNDDNGIRRGELYELQYMNEYGKWVSLGAKVAQNDDEIRFDGVPQGCLLWIRNRTKGHEERIFEYEDGKVIWR